MRVYQNVKSGFSNLHFVTFYMNKAVSELKITVKSLKRLYFWRI